MTASVDTSNVTASLYLGAALSADVRVKALIGIMVIDDVDALLPPAAASAAALLPRARAPMTHAIRMVLLNI